MPKYLNQYKFSILLALFIFLVSLIPGNSMPDASFFEIGSLDKLVHFGLYAFFCGVALLESRCRVSCLGYHFILMGSIFTMSALIEVLQATVVSTRSAEWLDLVANGAGLAAGYVAYRIFRHLIS